MSDVTAALALLDAMLPPRAEDSATVLQHRLGAMGVYMPQLGVGTETRGCPSCGGTMISNYEVDDRGNVTNQGPFICTSCGGCG